MKPNFIFRKILTPVCFIALLSYSSVAQNVGINADGATPDVSAMLDIVSSGKGLLLPRVALSSSTDAVTVATPATSLLVYNTNAGITGTYGDGVGYYYNAGTSGSPSWRKLAAGGDIRWDDLRVSLDNESNGATLTYLSGSSGPQIWFFRESAPTDMMSFTVQLPHTWVEGTTIYPHLHWLPKNNGSGKVEWNLDYTWANYNPLPTEVFPAISTSTVTETAPAGGFVANSHTITALTSGNAGIDGTGKKISSILICRIWRKADSGADTYTSDAGVLFLDFHIQTDGYGSRQTFVK